LNFHKGSAILEETDRNQKGIVEYRIHYKFGQLDTIEFIDEETGKIRKRQFYGIGKLSSADYDSNGDGHLDTHYEYDKHEEIDKKILQVAQIESVRKRVSQFSQALCFIGGITL